MTIPDKIQDAALEYLKRSKHFNIVIVMCVVLLISMCIWYTSFYIFAPSFYHKTPFGVLLIFAFVISFGSYLLCFGINFTDEERFIIKSYAVSYNQEETTDPQSKVIRREPSRKQHELILASGFWGGLISVLLAGTVVGVAGSALGLMHFVGNYIQIHNPNFHGLKAQQFNFRLHWIFNIRSVISFYFSFLVIFYFIYSFLYSRTYKKYKRSKTPPQL